MSWRKHPHDSSRHGELPTDADIVQKRKIVGVVTLATISAIVLLVSACLVVLCCPMPELVDNTESTNSTFAHSVGATRLQTVCPIRLSLPDLAHYGDSQYNESEGDLQSYARYGAFGDVYRASIRNMRDTEDQSVVLKMKSTDDYTSAFAYKSDVNHDAKVLEGRLSHVESGTGIAASMVSWATQGDVRGLSASSCSMPSMKQTFLVPENSAGTSLRLESFNTASKPTVVRVRAWSAKHGNSPIALSTGSAFTVPARSHAYFDLSAAAPQSSGLFVQIESEQTPVAAFIKVVRMSGLTVKGVDIIRDLNPQSNNSILSGIKEGDQAKLYVWPSKDGNVSLSWMNDKGANTVKELSLKSNNLQIVDLGKVPDHVHALSISGNVPTKAMMSVYKDGKDGQADVAFITASRSYSSSAVVSPVTSAETTLYLASSRDKNSTVKILGFDFSGVLSGTKQVTIPAHSVLSIPAENVSRNSVMFTAQSNDGVYLSARIRKDEVDKAGIAGIAWLASQSLEPQQMQVYVRNNHQIVH